MTPSSETEIFLGVVPIGRQGRKCAFFTPKFGYLGPKVNFCFVIAIFVDGTNDHYTRGYNFPIGTTPKKISVVLLGHFFDGPDDSPEFRRNRTKIKGSCPSNVGKAKIGQKWGEPQKMTPSSETEIFL